MPGPVDTWERTYVVDDGTSCRMPSLRPGPQEQRSPGLWARAEAVFQAYERALILMPAAIAKKTGYALGDLLKGLLPGLQQVLVVLAATTALGATVGGVIGFFFGGVGAAPGAVVGGELGFEIGSAALTWLGLGFLALAIASGFSELWATLSRGVERAWAAPEHSPREYPHEVESAAQDMADAAGVLFLLILQAIVAWVLKEAAVGSTKGALATGRAIGAGETDLAANEAVGAIVKQLRASRLGKGFGDWVEENWPRLRDDPRLRFRTRPPTADQPAGGSTGLLPPPREVPPPTPEQQAGALPGHGHARHGSQTTIQQQTARVQTGVAPDGQIAPTARATRFDSPEAELDAVARAQGRTANRVATGQKSEAIEVGPDGTARLPRDTSVVTGHPGGYGSGVEVLRDPATGQPLPGRPVSPTGQDPNALVVLQYDPAAGTWQPVTQYPTNRPVTP